MTERLDHLLRRAEQEAVQAVSAHHPAAAAAHREMSLRYSVRAVSVLRGG